MSVEKEKLEKAAPADFAPDMIFEQEPSQLLNALLPLYLNGQLLRVLQVTNPHPNPNPNPNPNPEPEP